LCGRCGAIAQFEKASLVTKLKAARDRKIAQGIKCGGRKTYLERDPELVKAAKELSAQRPLTIIAQIAAERDGKITPTPLYAKLTEAARDIKPKCIAIDTSADVFGGNEIDRTQVRGFINLLRKLAIVADGVVLLAHHSLTGINSGYGFSGSTAWHNSVRARLFLKTRKPANDDDGDGAGWPLRRDADAVLCRLRMTRP